MKIRNLLVLMMTMALTTLCVSAQQGEGEVTITDYSNQSLTISRFGTVVRFKDKNNKVTESSHTYKICTCDKEPKCIDPNSPAGAETDLKVLFPKPGQILKKGKTLKIEVTIKAGGVTLTRRLAWFAGSSVVQVVGTMTTNNTNVCSNEERNMVLAGDSCSMPPPENAKCPPPPTYSTWLWKIICYWKGYLVSYVIDVSRSATVVL